MQTDETAVAHVGGTASPGKASAYAELHKADWIPVNYDENIYNPAGYDTFAWNLYKPRLIQIVQAIAQRHTRLKYLDFACGTGRIIATLEEYVTEAVGLDISPQMVAFSQRKTTRSTVLCGDILEEPEVVDSDYDLITAFRFFLNTEPEMRQPVMRSLASRLANADSRLIFNIHMNTWSADGIKSMYRQLRGWGSLTTLSYRDALRLTRDAGLEIEEWYGFTLWPLRLYRGRFSRVFKWLDHVAAHIRPLRWISHDLMFVCRPRQGNEN